MGVLAPGDVLEVQHVLFAKVEANGAISISIGDVHAEDAVDSNVPVMQTWGFVSLPPSPVAGVSAAETVLWKTGGADVAIAGRDVRGMSIAGNLRMGEACVYAPGSQARTMYKLSGGVTHMTTADNTVTGETVLADVAPTGHTWFAPWGKLTFDATGFNVTTTSGAELHMGGMGAPAPLDSFSRRVHFMGDLVRIEGSAVVLGASTGVAYPVAKATPELLAALGAVATALTALAVPSSMVVPVAATGIVVPNGPTLTALGNAASALAAAVATLSSLSTSTT